MKYIHEAFKAFREMPDNSSSEFAKAVSDKIKKSEYYPLAGLMKKIGSPKRNILIKPYLLKDDEIEDNNLKNSKNLKENFKKKIYEKIETMQKDLGSLINEVNFKKNNEKKEFHKNYQVAKEKEDHSDMSNFINAKEKIFNRTKKNLHVVTLNFDETENLLVIGLINCEIRIIKLEFNEKEIKEELIHSQILDHIVFNACFGKHKSLNAFCLFLSLENEIFKVYKLKNYKEKISFSKEEMLSKTIGIQKHNIMKFFENFGLVFSNFQGDVLIYQENHLSPYYIFRNTFRIKTPQNELFSINAYDFCCKDSLLGFASCDGKIAIYNVFSKGECCQIVEAHKMEINDIFFYENQFQIISICTDHTISVWDYRNLKKVVYLNDEKLSKISKNKVKSCYFNKKKELLVIKARAFTFWKMETNENLFYDKEKLKHSLKWSETKKDQEKHFKDQMDIFQLRSSQIDDKGDKILVLDDKKTIKIYSILDKKWEFSYVATQIKPKIKCASFTLWPNIIAFVCEQGVIYLMNIFSDEIFQEINIFPLQANNILFFPNSKVNEQYSCAFLTENNEGNVVLYKILPKNRKPNRRNKLLRGHLKPIIASQFNEKYLATADQGNVLIIWELTYFQLLKSFLIPTQINSEGNNEVAYSLKLHPTKKDILFIAMENGDLHEFNISEGIFVKTYFLNLGIQPSFCFDDGAFFLINFNANLNVEFYKKDLTMISNVSDNKYNNQLELPMRAKTHVNLQGITQKMIKTQNNKESGFIDSEVSKKLAIFDLKKSLEPVTNKPILSLKLLDSGKNLEWFQISHSTYYSNNKLNTLNTHKNSFFSPKSMVFITILSDSDIVYWKKTGEILYVFNILKEIEVPLSLININESEEFQ